MARKKETLLKVEKSQLTLEEKRKNLAKLIQGINESSNEIVCGFISDEAIKKQINVEFIPTPNEDLNKAVGGGFPKGRISIVSGQPDSGKQNYRICA